jgi:phage terminase large subunit-like protein
MIDVTKGGGQMSLSNTAIPIEYGNFRQLVMNGDIPVNEEISLQMNRMDFLIDSPDYYYDDEAILGFILFCENECTLADGDDLILLPSFKLWAEDLLAWFYFIDEKVWDSRTRRYTRVTKKKRLVNKQYLIVSRGGAKSMYASLIQQYFLNVDTTTTHQIVTAPTMKQAEETMNPARTAIAKARGPLYQFLTKGNKQSNTWTKVKLASTKKGIENFLTNSKIEVRVMSIDKLQGLGSKVNTVDEWLSGKVKEDVIGALEQGASKLDDYVIIATSSEGTTRNGVGDTIKLELQDILRGNYFDPHTSIWHYKLDDVSEVGNPEMWVKANPNIGATVSYETYEKDVNRMEAVPSERNDILAKRFGIPVEGASYFFTYEDTLPHRRQNFDGMLCAMGGDLSQGDDFCAFTFLFPMNNGHFGVKTRSYVSELKVRKLPKAMRDKYQEFIDEGTLEVLDGAVLDMMEVYRDLDEFILKHEYTVISFGYDPYNATDIVSMWIKERGEYGLTKVIQGARTESVPLGELGHLAGERFLLFDEVLMKFAMGNAIAVTDTNGNRKLSKKRDSEKIDNVAALLDAWVAYKRFQEAFE